jgi:hypothetical protein
MQGIASAGGVGFAERGRGRSCLVWFPRPNRSGRGVASYPAGGDPKPTAQCSRIQGSSVSDRALHPVPRPMAPPRRGSRQSEALLPSWRIRRRQDLQGGHRGHAGWSLRAAEFDAGGLSGGRKEHAALLLHEVREEERLSRAPPAPNDGQLRLARTTHVPDFGETITLVVPIDEAVVWSEEAKSASNMRRCPHVVLRPRHGVEQLSSLAEVVRTRNPVQEQENRVTTVASGDAVHHQCDKIRK